MQVCLSLILTQKKGIIQSSQHVFGNVFKRKKNNHLPSLRISSVPLGVWEGLVVPSIPLYNKHLFVFKVIFLFCFCLIEHNDQQVLSTLIDTYWVLRFKKIGFDAKNPKIGCFNLSSQVLHVLKTNADR